ncbi:Rad21/Rec8-like protein, C-terminal, partial [Cynara cardunculus var. scolymus]
MVLDETDEELQLTEIPTIQQDPESKNTKFSDDFMIFEDSEHLAKEDCRNKKYPDEDCTTGETMISEMTLVGNMTLKPSPEKRQLSVSIDVTPQSKAPAVSGEHKSDFVAIRTPASKEHAWPPRKRRLVYDDTIVVPNKVFKNWLADAGDLVGKRRKASYPLLTRKECRSFDFVLEPIIPIIFSLPPVNAEFPSDLTSVISTNKVLVLEKVEDTMERDSKLDELGSLNTPKTSEQKETEAIAPSTPVTHSTSLRFNETNSSRSGEKELFPIEDVELDEIQMKKLGSVFERSVGSYLHSNLVQREERGEEEVINLSQILKHKTKKESARFFSEMLILKTGGYIDVKQGKAYDDIRVMQTSKLKEVFGKG